jgi:hypothetical protein
MAAANAAGALPIFRCTPSKPRSWLGDGAAHNLIALCSNRHDEAYSPELRSSLARLDNRNLASPAMLVAQVVWTEGEVLRVALSIRVLFA